MSSPSTPPLSPLQLNGLASRVAHLDRLLQYPVPINPRHHDLQQALKVIRSDARAMQDTMYDSEGSFAMAADNVDYYPSIVPDLLHGILWRAQYQRVVFDVFLLLCRQRLCSISALESDIMYGRSDRTSTMILGALWCFPSLEPLLQPSSKEVDNFPGWKSFEAPVKWLSVMMARTAHDLSACIKAIIDSGLLGPINEREYKQTPASLQSATWKLHAHELAPPSEDFGDPHPPFFAYILPAGLDMYMSDRPIDVVEERFYRQWNRYNTVFEGFFQVREGDRLSNIASPGSDEH